MFTTYFQLGLEHIAALDGFDHMLFLAALIAVYQPHQWKRILGLVTAFTAGHSITLALATLDLVNVSATVVERGIALTILLTAIANFWPLKRDPLLIRYAITTVFGLIHGLGFSRQLRALLGDDESVFSPLLAFNLGVEAGQVIVVLLTLGLQAILLYAVKLPFPWWTRALSALATVSSVVLLIQHF